MEMVSFLNFSTTVFLLLMGVTEVLCAFDKLVPFGQNTFWQDSSDLKNISPRDKWV